MLNMAVTAGHLPENMCSAAESIHTDIVMIIKNVVYNAGSSTSRF